MAGIWCVCVAAYRKCQPDDFRCVGTTPELCIPKEKKCDGYLDCRNGRDEERCENNMKPACRLDQFRCNTTQRCVEQNVRCDHRDDCGDNSDEDHCSELAFFPLASFLQYSLRFVPLSLFLPSSFTQFRFTFHFLSLLFSRLVLIFHFNHIEEKKDVSGYFCLEGYTIVCGIEVQLTILSNRLSIN